MACKYIYKGTTYSSKEEFISKVIPTLQNSTLSKFDKVPTSKQVYLSSIKNYEDNIVNFEKAIQAIKDNNYKIILPNNAGRYVASVESEGIRGGTIPIAKNPYSKESKEGKFDKEYALSYLKERIKIEKGSIENENRKIKELEEVENDIYNKNISSNQFLQLLNKDNNWVTFFVKSIIQDSAKKGYEKVLFPTGNTASKVEGHTTLEEFKKQKEDRIYELELENAEREKLNIVESKDGEDRFFIIKTEKSEILSSGFIKRQDAQDWINSDRDRRTIEINQLKQELERVEIEGFGALKPIYNFYENTVTNILKKQGYNPILITDEYGNTWNEIIIESKRDLKDIIFQKLGTDLKNANNEKTTLVILAKRLANRMKMPIEFIDDETQKFKGYFNGKKVVINLAYAKKDTLVHEILGHPIINEIKKQNPVLYKNLIAQLNTEQGQKILEKVQRLYSEYSAEEQQDEALVEMIGLLGSEKLDMKAKNLFQQLLQKITEFIQDLFGLNELDVTKITPNISLDELSKLMLNKKVSLSNNSIANQFQVVENERSSMSKMLDQLKIQLQERMRLLNTRIFNDDYNTFAANVKLRKMQNALDSLPELEAIVFYIEDANENLAKAHTTLKRIVENKDLKIKDSLKKMVEIFQLAQIYENTLNKLNEYLTVDDEELYKITSTTNDDSNTLQRKLANAIENRKKIETYFIKEGVSRMAKILSQSANGKPLAVIKRIEKLEQRILKEKNISKKAYLEKQLNAVKSINYGDEASIKESLTFASKDVSLFEYLTIPLTSSTDTTLASFALKLKNTLEEARLSLQDDIREARQKLEEYIEKTGIKTGNTAKLYEGMYEDINEVRIKKLDDGSYEIIESTYKSFTNPNDLNDYYKALKKAYETFNETRDKKVLVSFYKQYTQAKPLTEINRLIDYYDKLLEEGVISQEDFDEYIIRNIEGDYDLYSMYRSGAIDSTQYALALISDIRRNPNLAMRDFAIPKYKLNENYVALQKETAKFEFYNYIVEKHLESQQKLPTYQRLGYRLPSIRKSGKDRIIEGEIWGLLQDSFKVDFGEASDDYEKYGLQETDSSRSKTIPVMYVQKMDANEISLDLLSSVLRESAANNKYEALMNARPEIDTFTALINNREVAKTNSEGQGILNKLAAKIGIEDYVVKHESSYGAAMLDAFIDNVVFGKEKKSETFRGVKVDKLIDSLSRYAAFTQLGGIKLILNATNYINARVQLDVEAKSREFFTKDSINFSRIATNKYLAVDFMKDFSQPYAKSFIGNLIEIYDPLQGNYTDQFGREVSSQLAKKLFSTNTWFIGQTAGEFSIALQTMLASLHATKIDGKSLYDIHKEEFESKGKIDFKQEEVNTTRNKLHEILKEMNGVYNSFDRVAAKQYTIGRMLLMYRNFIPMGISRRFGSLKYNKGKESLSEGYYITFFRTLFKDFEEMVKFLNPLDNSNSELSESEIQNIKKALTELMWIGSLGVLALLLNSLDWDDDEDNLIKGNLAYLNLKLLNELRFYIWPESVTQILSNPTALFSIVKRFNNLFTQAFDITEEYKRDAGIWSKGDNKFLVRLLQIIGINGYMFAPDYAIEIMRKAGI